MNYLFWVYNLMIHSDDHDYDLILLIAITESSSAIYIRTYNSFHAGLACGDSNRLQGFMENVIYKPFQTLWKQI